MTAKEKAIEAIEKAWEIINDKQPETTEEINLIRFAVNTARQLIVKPTLDDAIAVVEKKFEKDNERLRKIIQAYYSKSWLVTLSKNILAYNIDFQMEIKSALKGLKEGK